MLELLSALVMSAAEPLADEMLPPEPLDEPRRVATISFSPLSVFMLGAVLEGEFRVSGRFTVYAAGEFYALWLGYGAQLGARWYTAGEAFRGFFVDWHFRLHDLAFSRIVGGGLEIGSQHQFGTSNWSILWSVGVDGGLGDIGLTRVARGIGGRPTIAPKLRLMLAYSF